MTAAEQIKYNKALKEAEEIQKRIDDGVKIRLKTAERLGKKLEEISKFEEKTLKAKQAQYKADADQLNLTEKIEKLSSSMLGNLSKMSGEGNDFSKSLSAAAKSGDEAAMKAGNAFADLLEKVNSGELGESGILGALGDTDFGVHEEEVKKLADAMGKSPRMQDIFKVKAQTFAALEKAGGGVLRTVRAIMAATGPIGILIAAAGFLVAKVVEMVVETGKMTMELRSSMGTSMMQSANLAANIQAARVSTMFMGGDLETSRDAVTGLVSAFRNVDVVTNSTATAASKLLLNTGLSGDEAGKLLKTMSLINGNSIETNVNTLLTKDNLMEAGGVRTAAVFKQLAGDTNLFAKSSIRGADALFRAAEAAEKMGVELSKFDQFADSLLDVGATLDAQARLESIPGLAGSGINLGSLMQTAQFGTLEDLQNSLATQLRGVDLQAIVRSGRAQTKELENLLKFSIEDLMKIQAGESVDGTGAPAVAANQLDAANEANRLSVEHHGEIKAELQELQRQNTELIRKMRDMGG
tara:strand:+ start:4531 stop:6105 length:1575 start_codon:yes stop_codon:yes gene_type:complete